MTLHMPVHPYTGLVAIGFRRNGAPIWPVKGGSEDAGAGDAGQDGAGQDDTSQDDQGGDGKPDIDWKAKSREWERKAKANAGAAKRLAEIEEASKSETQKLADAKAAVEKERDAARTESMRLRVATKHGISTEDADLFLTGADEETLTRQAERLAQRDGERKKNKNHVPREGANNSAATGAGDEREFVRELFGSGG